MPATISHGCGPHGNGNCWRRRSRHFSHLSLPPPSWTAGFRIESEGNGEVDHDHGGGRTAEDRAACSRDRLLGKRQEHSGTKAWRPARPAAHLHGPGNFLAAWLADEAEAGATRPPAGYRCARALD